MRQEVKINMKNTKYVAIAGISRYLELEERNEIV